jgi:hypothetical protein
MKTYLIKVYHGYTAGKKQIQQFLTDINDALSGKSILFWLHYRRGEFFYSLNCDDETYPSLESQFYTSFDNFQVINDTKKTRQRDSKKTAVAKITLDHKGFFPFRMTDGDDTGLMFNMLRSYENLDIIHDKFSYLIAIEPMDTDGLGFYISNLWSTFVFKLKLFLTWYKHLFSIKTQKNRKQEGFLYYEEKIHEKLNKVSLYMVCESETQKQARGKIKAIANNFEVFANYPQNTFRVEKIQISWWSKHGSWFQDLIHKAVDMVLGEESSGANQWDTSVAITPTAFLAPDDLIMTPKEISQIFQFPQNPKNETSLLKVTSKKLSLPIGIPTLPYKRLDNGEIIHTQVEEHMNILGISDFRSISVPVGFLDEDRVKHTYIIGKTWTGKSKYIVSMIVNDIKSGKGMCVIDPHGDLVDEALQFVPESRKQDVIIFDPSDEEFPFCLNPLDIKSTESKQILAKWFIDIFKKFFWANWNAMLEHVLRMIFLALLDKPNATMFDIIRALTDKDFRYEMIENIEDDVVRNFWTNEFAGRSQQFNTQAIMPILNKVGQILSIDVLKNIFASKENKLDFRTAMDEGKLIFIKLSKGKLQEEIMGFLGAMFITKIYQTAMGRAGTDKSDRRKFFLYVDEFQNFATETFNEILSEARKYGLGMTVAHQFVKQIPADISDALFGNVGTLISFRISAEDAGYMKQHFAPFLEGYDLENLNQRELYCKTQVKWQTKDPFSLRSPYFPDPKIEPTYIQSLYDISRKKYSRSLAEAKLVVNEEQKDVLSTIEEFAEPMI